MTRFRAAIVAVEKERVLHNLCVYFLPWVSSMQSECVILPSVACPALQNFSTFSHKRNDFRKKKVSEYKICILISLQLLSEIFLILRRNERGTIKKNVNWSSCKLPFIVVRF